MRNPVKPAMLAALAAGILGACASSGEALPVPQTADGVPVIPEGAIESVVVQDNGDVVHEYRVQGQLRMLKVVPFRGPTYYLIDRNGDGRVSAEDGEAPAVYYKLFSW